HPFGLAQPGIFGVISAACGLAAKPVAAMSEREPVLWGEGPSAWRRALGLVGMSDDLMSVRILAESASRFVRVDTSRLFIRFDSQGDNFLQFCSLFELASTLQRHALPVGGLRISLHLLESGPAAPRHNLVVGAARLGQASGASLPQAVRAQAQEACDSAPLA